MSSIFTIGPVPREVFTVYSFDGGTLVELDDQTDSAPFQVDAQAA